MPCLFADDTVLFADSEKELQRVVDEFYMVCRKEVEVVDFNTLYRLSVPPVGRCEVVLGRSESIC